MRGGTISPWVVVLACDPVNITEGKKKKRTVLAALTPQSIRR
jgi:hypothetical protein